MENMCSAGQALRLLYSMGIRGYQGPDPQLGEVSSDQAVRNLKLKT
jgi:hypothetical protein